MRITPLDVRKQEFKKGMRGYDAEEVQAFLTTVADEYEAVLLDNKQLRERILELDEKIQEYRHMEKTLRDTLMTAERVLSEAKDNARKEADLILKDSEMKAQQATENFRRQAAELRREVIELHKEKESYLARCRGLAEAQIQFIDNHRTDFDDLDRRLMGQLSPRQQGAARRSAADEAGAPPAGGAVASAERAASRAQERDEWRDYEPGLPGSAAPSPGRAPTEKQEPPRPAAEALRPQPPAAARTESWDDAEVEEPQQKPAPRAAAAEAPDRRNASFAPEDVDELLEPLHAVEELARDETAAAADPSAGPERTPREQDDAWNMDSFTRGLSEL